ncbi:hypothetical protein H072_8733 [Dactylellina haptotyla CBS 200.50]|uniref:Uncharacterized protein n=1 Tax=Dactylellina haptotyla (strain CBS 200.50) TaxID=1284197 RepID=S8BQP2_DACHA|nr:hypothetical protein H072_8733 [Dactylellina haptotyla CBS 200.50]
MSPTALLPKSANAVSLPPSRIPDTPNSPSFPSELPTPKSAGLKSLSLDEAVKTPITPPSAYLDFLKTSIVMRTPTSATFKDVSLPPTSAPLSAGCTCRGRRMFKKSAISRRSGTESGSNSSSRESSCDSMGSASCCSNYCYYPPPTPYTPMTPSSLKTPLSGTKRLRIPPSPAFSPNYNAAFESPFPIYTSATPRTPITEEDEEDIIEAGILSAGGERAKKSACRHKKIVTVRADAAGMSRAARMKLMAAPKGKKRRVD